MDAQNLVLEWDCDREGQINIPGHMPLDALSAHLLQGPKKVCWGQPIAFGMGLCETVAAEPGRVLGR
jgi:hypothetical protein